MRRESFSLSLEAPLSTADGAIDRRDGFVVRTEHRGETGVGEATPLPGWTESLGECEAALDRVRAAETDSDTDAPLREPDGRERPAARHGVSSALLDADARADGVPLYRWLGADRSRECVPVNATLGDGAVEETVERARDAVADGFDCLKLKVGARSVEADVDRVRAVREAVGAGVAIRLDANGAWDRDEARQAFDALGPLDVAYVEQPLPAADLEGLAALRGSPVGVAVDETLVTRPMTAVLDAAAADVVVLKPMVLGGPGNAYTLATRAQTAGVDPVVTTTVDAVVARAAAVHVAAAIPDVRPCGLATAARLAADLGPDPAPVTDGQVRVPQEPGIGIDPGEVSP